jgi:methylmalonyl-CoA decarboxylase subunit alpha
MATQYDYESQHRKGKLHAFERIEKLLDKGSFIEIGSMVQHHSNDFGMDKKKIPYDGVITGFGEIDGKKSCHIFPRFLCDGRISRRDAWEKNCEYNEVGD